MVRLVALELGIWNGARVRPGVQFDFPDDLKLPKWAVPVGDAKASPAAPPLPTTLSEMTPKPKKRGRPPQTFREIADDGV